MKYPQFLTIGNWLFEHIEPNSFYDIKVGGERPTNIYIVRHGFQAIDLSTGLRTYEGLIENDATEPTDKELLRLIKR